MQESLASRHDSCDVCCYLCVRKTKESTRPAKVHCEEKAKEEEKEEQQQDGGKIGCTVCFCEIDPKSVRCTSCGRDTCSRCASSWFDAVMEKNTGRFVMDRSTGLPGYELHVYGCPACRYPLPLTPEQMDRFHAIVLQEEMDSGTTTGRPRPDDYSSLKSEPREYPRSTTDLPAHPVPPPL